MKKQLKSSNTAVYNIGYHLIWCPKYRREVLVGGMKERLQELLFEKAYPMGIKIIEMEIMPDHVHLFIKTIPQTAPFWIVKHLKGYSSRILKLEFPQSLSQISALWTRSYDCESVGHISEETIRKVIASQRKNQCLERPHPPL